MRERLALFIFIGLIAMSFAAADFSAQITSASGVILPGNDATYEVQIQNLDSVNDRYSIGSPSDSRFIRFVDERPEALIPPGETGTFTVRLSPKSTVGYGTYSVPLDVTSRETGEVSTVNFIIALQNPDSTSRQYAPSIALSVGAPSEVDPREDLKLSIGLRNRNARPYEQSELTVLIYSDLFSDSYQTSLGSVTQNAEKTTERIIEIDDNQPAGEHPLNVRVIVHDTTAGGEPINRTVSEYESTFTIQGYSQLDQATAQDQFLFKTTTTHTFTNTGNLPADAQVVVPLSAIKQLFTSSSHNYEIQDVDGDRSLVATQELVPLESTSITVTHNYRLLVILILLSIVSVIGYYLLRSPVVLDKEAEISGDLDENQTELKTRLFIKNRGSQTLRNVKVVDRVSGLAEVITENTLGTLKPTKVVKKKSQGTLIRWDIETLEPFEERIISYTVHTPLALVGDITLPSLKVTFESEGGRQRTTHSNDVQIRRND